MSILLAPAKTMTARERLDAEFVEAEAPGVASRAPAKAANAPASTSDNSNDVQAPVEAAAESDPAKPQRQEQVAAQDDAAKPSDEPPMIGSCDRMWARIALKPQAEVS